MISRLTSLARTLASARPRVFFWLGIGAGGATFLVSNLLFNTGSWVASHRWFMLSLAVVAVVVFLVAIGLLVVGRGPSLLFRLGRLVERTGVFLYGLIVVVVVLGAFAILFPKLSVVPVHVPTVKQLDFKTYVALGDSYSAGEGVSQYEPGSGDAAPGQDDCHRSTRAYPLQLTFAHRLSRPVIFHACSGARIGHIYDFIQRTHGIQRNRFGTQVPGVLGPQVGLVTLTIGGNDFHFGDVITFCLLYPNCLQKTFTPTPTPCVDPSNVITLQPCPDERDTPPPAPLMKWAQSMMPVVRARLDKS